MKRFWTAAVIVLLVSGCRPTPSGDRAGTISIKHETGESPGGCEGGVFYIDGRMEGRYPVSDFPVKPASHTITINSVGDCAGHGDLRLEIKKGEKKTLHPKQFK
ncbi:MAG: hypothetical protein ABIJ56_16325 [Pseudomonadota bacterium]